MKFPRILNHGYLIPSFLQPAYSGIYRSQQQPKRVHIETKVAQNWLLSSSGKPMNENNRAPRRVGLNVCAWGIEYSKRGCSWSKERSLLVPEGRMSTQVGLANSLDIVKGTSHRSKSLRRSSSIWAMIRQHANGVGGIWSWNFQLLLHLHKHLWTRTYTRRGGSIQLLLDSYSALSWISVNGLLQYCSYDPWTCWQIH